MAEASRKIRQMLFPGEATATVERLKFVAATFVQLHDAREQADYDTTIPWEMSDALSEVQRAALAFEEWQAVRLEPIAQAYVASLLVKGQRS